MDNLFLCFNPEFDNELNNDLFYVNEIDDRKENEIDSILDEFDY